MSGSGGVKAGEKRKRGGFFFLYSKGATEPLHFIGSSSRVGSGLCTSGGSLKAEANARARTEHRQSQRGSRKCHRRTGEKARNGPSAFHFIFLIDSKAIASQKRVNNHRRCQVKLSASHPRSSRLCRAAEPSQKKKYFSFPSLLVLHAHKRSSRGVGEPHRPRRFLGICGDIDRAACS